MRFLELKQNLKKFSVFSLNDIRKIEPNFDIRRINEWQEKGYIKKIRRSYYIFSDLEINESVLFLIANKIYSPSYVSFESALSYYNFIPEAVYNITSASSNKTNKFQSNLATFIYSHIKPDLMFGFRLKNCENHCYKIADPEKALLDYFYLNPKLKEEKDFEEMRFNLEEINSKIDFEKMNTYLEVFESLNFKKKFKRFVNYIKQG